MANLYSKLADLIEKHPKRVILTWVVVLLLALPLGVMTMTQPGVLQYDMTAMVGDDSESVQGMYILADTNYFDSGSTGMDPIIVVEVPTNPANDTTIKNGISNFVDELNNSLSDEYDKGFVSIMDAGFYSKNSSGSGIEMIALTFTADVNVNKQIPTIRELVDDAKDASGMDYTTYVTGSSAINFDTEDGAMTDVKRIDPFSILLVLILIGLFFRSFVSAATPPCVIGFAYAMTLAVIFVEEGVHVPLHLQFAAVQTELFDVKLLAAHRQCSQRGGHENFVFVEPLYLHHAGYRQGSAILHHYPVGGLDLQMIFISHG